MKKLLFIALSLTMLFSCRKENTRLSQDDQLILKANNYLKIKLSETDYQQLDFSKGVYTNYDSNTSTVRVAFKNKKYSESFIALKFKDGNIEKAKIIELLQIREVSRAVPSKQSFNGYITIQSLDRKTDLQSNIEDGFITAWHSKLQLEQQKVEVVPDPYQTLPEVVVVAYIPRGGGGISWSTWASVLALLDGGGGGGYWGNSQYDYLDPLAGGSGGGGGGGTGTGGSSGGGNYIPPIEIDYENQYSDPAIEIEKYLKCFADIPDAGAAGSIEIFTDIPVNGDPTKFFDWSNGSPGHVFIQLKKQNGSQSVTQNIGFYPASGWKTTLTPAPIEGKFVDNKEHEFNASYKLNLTSGQIQTAVTRMLYLARFVKYDIDEYNCTDWALDVFNQTVSVEQQLEIPKYDIPGGMAPFGTSTPQGLYQKLEQLKQAGGNAAANINIPLVGWVGRSNGPCN